LAEQNGSRRALARRRSSFSDSLSAVGGRNRPLAPFAPVGGFGGRDLTGASESFKAAHRRAAARSASVRGSVGAHAVALPVDLEDDASVEEPVEHRGGDHRVVEICPSWRCRGWS
jgi:hypothetical protein